jgi:hypothetical protein
MPKPARHLALDHARNVGAFVIGALIRYSGFVIRHSARGSNPDD